MRSRYSAIRRLVLPAAAVVIALTTMPSLCDAQEPVAETCSADYLIGQEDVLEIAVWNNTTITRTVPVRPDGKISLPLVDDIQAAGLSAMELRERLTKALTPYIPTPNVSVIV